MLLHISTILLQHTDIGSFIPRFMNPSRIAGSKINAISDANHNTDKPVILWIAFIDIAPVVNLIAGFVLNIRTGVLSSVLFTPRLFAKPMGVNKVSSR